MEQRLLPRSENQPNFAPMNWQRIITILAFALALFVGENSSLAQRVAYSPSLLSDVAQRGRRAGSRGEDAQHELRRADRAAYYPHYIPL